METDWPIDPWIVAKWWTKRKRIKFEKWAASEVAHEAWLALHKMKHRFDPEKGSLLNWAETNLWDPVNIAYCLAFGIKIKRPTIRVDGRSMACKRVYLNRWHALSGEHESLLVTNDDDFLSETEEEEDARIQSNGLRLSHKQRSLCELLSRGFNQRQCGYALGVHESAITQMLYTIRKNNATDPRASRPI